MSLETISIEGLFIFLHSIWAQYKQGKCTVATNILSEN